MVLNIRGACLATMGLLAAALPACAHAQQKSTENVVTSSDDAFGNSVGLETSGLYSQYSTRGFSPTDTGNARIDGIYYDPVSILTLRVKSSQAIRVGYAALEYPFTAPTGIVDTALRTAGNDFHAGLEAHLQQYGSHVVIFDTQIPVIDDHLALVAGISEGHAKFIDGARDRNFSYAIKPVIRLGSVEISPFYSNNVVRDSLPRPVVYIAGNFLPGIPPIKHYYGPAWAKGSKDNINLGGTIKARITGRLSLRAGLFESRLLRKVNYTDIYIVTDPAGHSIHEFLADPRQDLHSWSGEVQLGYRLQQGRWHHRFIAGFRGRDRYTEYGGSDCLDFGDAMLGVPDAGIDSPRLPPDLDCRAGLSPELQPEFFTSDVNRGTVKQTSFLAAYLGKLEGVGQVNFGLQRARFRGKSVTDTGTIRQGTDEWLYNASLGIDITHTLMIYGGTQRGLEDSGAAPDLAENRNEQLPPSLSKQYEAGLRWKLGKNVLLLSVFQITKPYYSYDTANVYTKVGTVKHSGIEASFSGHFIDDRLSVLAGVMVMKPVVSGPGRDEGRIGRAPVGQRGTRGRLDLNYRSDILSGLTPTFSLEYRGKSAAASDPIPGTDGEQVWVPSRVSIDLGLRQPLKIGHYPATLRIRVDDLLNQKRWVAVTSRTLLLADTRRFSAGLLVDF